MGLRSIARRYAERERGILAARKASKQKISTQKKLQRTSFKKAIETERRKAYLSEAKKQAISKAKLQAQRRYGGPVRNWLGQPIQQLIKKKQKKRKSKKKRTRTVVKYVYK